MRAAHPSEPPPQNTIVNAINYSFISQQPWPIGIFHFSLMLLRRYLASLGSLEKFYDFVIEIYIFVAHGIRVLRGSRG
jgi:hypothetical protein